MAEKVIWELLLSDAVDMKGVVPTRHERDKRLYVIELTSVLGTDFTIKINVKKQRRFNRSTVIFKLNYKNF